MIITFPFMVLHMAFSSNTFRKYAEIIISLLIASVIGGREPISTRVQKLKLLPRSLTITFFISYSFWDLKCGPLKLTVLRRSNFLFDLLREHSSGYIKCAENRWDDGPLSRVQGTNPSVGSFRKTIIVSFPKAFVHMFGNLKSDFKVPIVWVGLIFLVLVLRIIPTLILV